MPRQADHPGWLTPTEGGWLIAIWAQPGARRTEAVSVVEGRLKLRVAAQPVEGKANEAILRWLAQRLEVPVRAVQLTSGETHRHKRVRVACALPAAVVADRLGPAP